MQNADPTLTRERNRKSRLGDRVHRGGDDRDRELDAARQPRPRRDVVRKDARLRRHEQNVVEGQPFLREFSLQLEQTFDVAPS